MAAYANVAPRVNPNFVPPRGCGRRHVAPKRAASWRASSAFAISRLTALPARRARESRQAIETAREIFEKTVSPAARINLQRQDRGRQSL